MRPNHRPRYSNNIGIVKWHSLPARLLVFITSATVSFPLYAAEFAPPIIFESPNPQREGWFGAADVSPVPDVTGDGKADILISATRESSGTSLPGAGRVYLFDGVTRELLLELRSPNEIRGSAFGYRATGIGDLNGDDRGEIIVASGLRESRVYVFDGTTGEVLYTMETSASSLSAVPDLNGDGRPDLVVGTSDFDSRSGSVSIYDGANGTELRSLNGGFFGGSVSGIPDVNGDGAGDVIVGARMDNRAYIHDGATGARLHTLTGSGQFGRSVAGLGDVNGDGRGDVVVGAQESNRAYIYDGAMGTLLHTLSAPGNPFRFGWIVNRLPDVDGDARDDVVVAGFQDYDQSRIPADAYVFSGASGELLATLPGHSDYGGGRSIAGMPDQNGDGLAEVLVASPLGYSTTGVFQAGQVSLYLSEGGQAPIEASVSIESLDHVYDETAKEIIVTTDPPGLAVEVTYDGEQTPPVNAGTYSVLVTVSEAGYTGSAEAVLTISKANQNINVEAAPTVAFDASPLGTIAESSAGLPVDFSLLSGPARWMDDNLIATGVGTIRIEALQAGDENIEPAEAVVIEIEILPPEDQTLGGTENEPVLIPVLGGETAGFDDAFPEETPHGMIEQTEQGWTYRSNSGFGGDDSFSYTLVDTETQTETEVAVTVSIERTTGTLVVQINLPEGGWRVAGEDTFRTGAGAEAVFLPAGDHQLEFHDVPGYATPEPLLVMLETGEEKTLEIDYLALSPYQDWLAENFTLEQMDDDTVSGREADIDRDGFPTIAEWALRLDPFLADALTVSREDGEGFTPHVQVVGEGEEQKLLLTFLRRTDHETLGLEYGAEFSTDLIEWSAGVLEAVFPVDENWERVTIASAVENGEISNLRSLFVHFGVMSSSIDNE